jgi:hypothetical protein
MLSLPTADVHAVVIAPAPDIVSVEEAAAMPVQNACAVLRLCPVQPEHRPDMVTLFSLAVPLSVRSLTVGDAARTTLPDPVVFEICEPLIRPLLSPRECLPTSPASP